MPKVTIFQIGRTRIEPRWSHPAYWLETWLMAPQLYGFGIWTTPTQKERTQPKDPLRAGMRWANGGIGERETEPFDC